MFIGHYGVALAAKRFAPKVSLATLMLAALLPDVLWILLTSANVEHAAIRPGITAVNALDLYDFPFSHSLLTNLLFASAFAGLYFTVRHHARGAWVIFAAVTSHWVLDFVSHRPDMPISPRLPTLVGLGLWNSPLGTFVVEGGIWLIGVLMYVRTTRPSERGGIYGFWIMIGLLTTLWLLSLTGTPPSGLYAVKLVNSVMLVFTMGWAFWMDRVRPPHPRIQIANPARAGA